MLERHLPGLSGTTLAGMGPSLTLGQVATFAPDRLPDEKLQAIVRDLQSGESSADNDAAADGA